MSFKFKTSPKERAGNNMISLVLRETLRAAAEEKAASGVTQQEVADKLGVHKSSVSRLLRGQSNLTLRSVGEFLWALGWEPDFQVKRKDEPSHNITKVTGSASNLVFLQDHVTNSPTTHTFVQRSPVKLEADA